MSGDCVREPLRVFVGTQGVFPHVIERVRLWMGCAWELVLHNNNEVLLSGSDFGCFLRLKTAFFAERVRLRERCTDCTA